MRLLLEVLEAAAEVVGRLAIVDSLALMSLCRDSAVALAPYRAALGFAASRPNLLVNGPSLSVATWVRLWNACATSLRQREIDPGVLLNASCATLYLNKDHICKIGAHEVCRGNASISKTDNFLIRFIGQALPREQLSATLMINVLAGVDRDGYFCHWEAVAVLSDGRVSYMRCNLGDPGNPAVNRGSMVICSNMEELLRSANISLCVSDSCLRFSGSVDCSIPLAACHPYLCRHGMGVPPAWRAYPDTAVSRLSSSRTSFLAGSTDPGRTCEVPCISYCHALDGDDPDVESFSTRSGRSRASSSPAMRGRGPDDTPDHATCRFGTIAMMR
eukprot:TRINITY_DN13632_c0_g1_i1.p1 TRINITY_DN13632_c0_g1~~TRINITY_DN13632_c0_g1_i1.p1  ORF type:complete len:331 (-),score=9.51 TRINITY_DN13632_c0_g1_i1:859-1851(-)